jgi:hypothetical protein
MSQNSPQRRLFGLVPYSSTLLQLFVSGEDIVTKIVDFLLLLRHTRKFIIPWCKTAKNHAQ